MTGTAETEAREFYEIYKLDVAGDPDQSAGVPQRPRGRGLPHQKEKYTAIIDEIVETHEHGQPVLVGHRLGGGLGVAVAHAQAARRGAPGAQRQVPSAGGGIVAGAGRPGAVTIATNMAGRGTDIKLGPGVADVGGLHIVGNRAARGAAHRPPAARPLRPAGRPRVVALLPVARGRPHAPVRRRAHRRPDDQARRPGGRGHRAPHGDALHRARAAPGGGLQLRDPQAPARIRRCDEQAAHRRLPICRNKLLENADVRGELREWIEERVAARLDKYLGAADATPRSGT